VVSKVIALQQETLVLPEGTRSHFGIGDEQFGNFLERDFGHAACVVLGLLRIESIKLNLRQQVARHP
jgi:hypothetical protein